MKTLLTIIFTFAATLNFFGQQVTEQNSSVTFKLSNDFITVAPVTINGKTFNFAIDTGSSSSAISRRAAQDAGIKATFRTEMITPQGSEIVPVGHAQISIAAAADAKSEILISDSLVNKLKAFDESIDGLIGQTFLANFNYKIDFKNSTISFGAQPETADGSKFPMKKSDGRDAVPVVVEGENKTLIIDSGASHLIVFTSGEKAGLEQTVFSKIAAGNTIFKKVAGFRAFTPQQRDYDGLLPTRFFESIFFDNKNQSISIKWLEKCR